jgi:hypothetical protein
MALVLYEGKAIAFGSSEEIFARVRAANGQPARAAQAAPTSSTKAARRAAVAESA